MGYPRRLDSFTLLISLPVFLMLPSFAIAQLQVGRGLLTNCEKIESLRKGGDIPGARDAATKCLEGLEQELDGEIGGYFLEEVAGWKRGRFEQNAAMGMRNASADYRKDDKTVRVSLIGGGGGRGLGGALGGFVRMGMMGGGKQVEVAGLPATVMPNGQVVVSFEDGSMLNFESSSFTTADAALAGMGDLIDKFPVAKIRDALQPR
jgi:hypothetical protein